MTEPNTDTALREADARLHLDRSLHSPTSVQAALNRLADHLSGELTISETAVELAVFFDQKDADHEVSIQLLRKELHDQGLRERVRDETADVRRLIIAHAFSRTSLAADER